VLDLVPKSHFSLVDGLELSLVLGVREDLHGFLKSHSNILELLLHVHLEVLKLSSELGVALVELLPVLTDLSVISGEFLMVRVVHSKGPHFKTLIMPFDVLLELVVKGLVLLDNGLELGSVLRVLHMVSEFLKSLTNLVALVFQELSKILKLSLDSLVGLDEFLLLHVDGFSFGSGVLEVIVVHVHGPHLLIRAGLFIIPLNILLDLVPESYFSLVDSLKLGLVFWLRHQLGSLLESMSDILEFFLHVMDGILKFHSELGVTLVEFLPVLSDFSVISGNLLLV